MAAPDNIPWASAVPMLFGRTRDMLKEVAEAPRAILVGVTGPVGAGKSTLAAQLSPCVVATDHYLPDYDTTPEDRRDLPESADFARLAQDLANLRARQHTRIPNWSFHTHR